MREQNEWQRLIEMNRVTEYWIGRCSRAEKQLEQYKWISVKDRLPDERIYDCPCCLVTDGSLIHMAYFVYGEWIFADSGQAKEKMFYKVTHWMPLPESPEYDRAGDDAEAMKENE